MIITGSLRVPILQEDTTFLRLIIEWGAPEFNETAFNKVPLVRIVNIIKWEVAKVWFYKSTTFPEVLRTFPTITICR